MKHSKDLRLAYTEEVHKQWAASPKRGACMDAYCRHCGYMLDTDLPIGYVEFLESLVDKAYERDSSDIRVQLEGVCTDTSTVILDASTV